MNNEVGLSVSVLDVQAGNRHRARRVRRRTPPEPGSFEHARLKGKLVFFTALGRAGQRAVGTPIRDDRAARSSAASSPTTRWSTCASCHPAGLADGVTWIFARRPAADDSARRSLLEAQRSARHAHQQLERGARQRHRLQQQLAQRAVRQPASPAGRPTPPPAALPFGSGAPNPNIFDHGISQGASEALDMETTWVQTVRAAERAAGRSRGARGRRRRLREPTARPATAAPSGPRAR